MAVVNLKGSKAITGLDADPVQLADAGIAGGAVRSFVETVEVNSDDSATSTYLMARLPSNAVILGMSKLYGDDLASSGAPTLDIGLFNKEGESFITDDDDALNDGISAAAAIDTAVVKDIANYGKKLYEHVNGQTEDPKCELDIKLTLKDAAVNVGGTLTLELFYTLD